MTVEENRGTIRRYSGYGLWIGLTLGVIAGVVVGGPRFREWENPALSWSLLIAACGIGGAIIGMLFFWLVSPNAGSGGGYGSGGGNGGDGD